MKKIIALVLSLVMMLTLFAGLNISAETDLTNVEMVAQRKRSEYAETKNPIGTDVHSSIANKGFGTTKTWNGGWTYEAPAEPDTHNLSMKLTANEVYGNTPLGFRTYFTLTPYFKIVPGVDAFMIYIELPEYNKFDSNPYMLNSLSFHVYEEGKSGVWKTPVDMDIKYLANDGTAWVASKVDATGKYQLPNGFKGYVKCYLNTAKVGGDTSTSYYDMLTANGFDTSDGFIVGTLQYELNYIGGAYGDLVVGGMYNILSDGDAITANLSDDGGTAHVKNAKLTGTNRHTPDGVTKFWNQRANYGVEGTAIGGGQAHFEMSKATLNWVESPIGSPSAIAKISSATAMGAKHGVTARLGQWVWTSVDPEIGIVGMYVELPRYDEGETWVMQTKGFNIGSAWNTPTNMRISYLAVDGKEWKEGVTGNNGEMYLPNGFKGYIKMYLKTATNGGSNTQSYYDALAQKGVDLTKPFTINYPQFDFNHLGGDYGDLYISQLYTVKEDGNDVVGNFTDWKYGEYVTAMTNGVHSITAERANPVYMDGTTYYEGAPVASGVASVSNKKWYTDAGETPKLTWTASKEPDSSNAAIRVHSDTVTGQGVPYGPPVVHFHPNVVITPGVDAAMLYVELPEKGVIGVDGSGHDYLIGFDTITVVQNGKTGFARLNNITVSYLGLEDTEWTTLTNNQGNERIYLPSGFKGYIKLHFDTAMQDVSKGLTTYQNLENNYKIDTSKDFIIKDLNFIFGWLGGKFGDMIIGGCYSIKEDGTAITANIYDKGTTEVRETSLTNFKNANQERMELITNTLNEIGDTVTVADGPAINAALAAYADLADYFKKELPEGTAETLNALAAQYDAAYRPNFGGVAAFKPDGSGYAGMKISTFVDASAAIAEGYYVAEYGTVALKETDYSISNPEFDATATNAIVESNINADNSANSFDWKMTIKTNDVSVFGLDYYFRSYVVYSNGTDFITVWNSDYENTALRTYDEVMPEDVKAAGRLPIQTIKTTNSSLIISLAGAANKFGFSIMGGAMVGNVDARFELGTYSNGWQHYVIESIKSTDLVAARKHILGTKLVKHWYTADMNGDGKVNVRDLVSLKKVVAGSIATATEELTNVLTNGGKVVLSDNAVVESQLVVPAGVDATINLNGKTLTLNYADNYALVAKGNLTIEGEGTVIIKGFGFSTGYNSQGTLTFNGGKYIANGCDYMIGCFGGEVTINSGEFIGEYCVVNNFSDYYGVEGTVTINGGILEAEEPVLGSPIVDNYK